MSKGIKAIYQAAGQTPPDGKGIHTKKFHSCVVKVTSDIKAGILRGLNDGDGVGRRNVKALTVKIYVNQERVGCGKFSWRETGK